MSAEVCLNGHTSTSDIERSPELAAKFCATCGAKTIRACPSCGAPIRGYYYVLGVFSFHAYERPNHCHNCGKAFPWTEAKLRAAKQQAAEIEELDESDRTQLQGAIDDLAEGGVKTELAASRFKRLMMKAGQTVSSGLYKVVLDVASEAAKKALIG